MTTALLLLSAGCAKNDDVPAMHSMYCWNTSFVLDSLKLDFIRRHNIERLYVRYFDVVGTSDNPAPNATVRFENTAEIPCEIVPVVYILNDCMKTDADGHKDLASKILKRVLQMSETHDIGPVKEIQIDCDWTKSTRTNYFAFLDNLRHQANELGIKLSTTIRLHQLSQPVPPADNGVLMVYNTGDLTDIGAQKPILDERVVAKYIKYIKDYPLDMATAYPIYKWDIVYRNGKFVDIKYDDNDLPVLASDTVVTRYATRDDILNSKQIIKKYRDDCHNEIILFDLNNYNIKRYGDEDYQAFFD